MEVGRWLILRAPFAIFLMPFCVSSQLSFCKFTMANASDPAIAQAYNDVRTKDNNWLLIGYQDNKTLKLVGTGSGGVEELAGHLSDDACFFGYLKVQLKDDETTRTKFIFFTWKGDTSPVMRKANMSIHVSAVKAVVKDFSVEINATEMSEVTSDFVRAKLKAANY